MASLIEKSSPVAKNELNLFSLPPTQVAVLRTYDLTFYPKNPLDPAAPILFDIPPSSDYTDVSNIILILKIRVLRADGAALTGQAACPINYPLNTIFQQVKVFSRGKLLWFSGDLYAQKAFIEAALGFPETAKKTFLQAAGWYADNPQHINSVQANNPGAFSRIAKTALSNEWEVAGNLHCDIFAHDKCFPSHVPLSLELLRNSNEFVIQSDGAEIYKLEVMDARLQVRLIQAVPSLNIAFEKMLSKAPARFALRRTEMKQIHLATGRRDLPITEIHQGQLPRRVIACFTRAQSYYGSQQQNPFRFEHFGLRQIELTAGGHTYPSDEPLRMDFEHHNFTRAYFNLQKSIQCSDGSPCTVSMEEFEHGSSYFIFDITPDSSANSDHFNPLLYGTLLLKVLFSQALQADVKLYLLLEFDSCLQMTKDRQFFLDYQV